MKVAALKKPGGLDNIVIEERDDPTPGPGEILVRVRATSLNFHDFAVVSGMMPTADGRIPMSDGAGEVVAVGDGVTDFNAGDAVVSLFFPNWDRGEPDLGCLSGVPGDHADGFAAELVAMPATAFTHAPAGYTMEQSATLTCAALTAWRGLMTRARIKPGDWVLTQGTGGVSIFALQFARAAGARVISTSSSNEKLEKLRALGADALINYRETPDWGVKARELTGGRGVDEVIEIGGAGTLTQSMTACRIGGHISLIGVLAGFAGEVNTAQLFSQNISLDGITVGSKVEQEDMIRTIEANGIQPVISNTFELENLKDAFELQAAQGHFGKIVVTL
ncbi:MAG: NAD(P)-dependent alcohol dehydrogenase [Proteobacteria bacterium]|nr:NAD(P)-dependent alcohol dehydrogenase [Pseudomonadota bacterium]